MKAWTQIKPFPWYPLPKGIKATCELIIDGYIILGTTHGVYVVQIYLDGTADEMICIGLENYEITTLEYSDKPLRQYVHNFRNGEDVELANAVVATTKKEEEGEEEEAPVFLLPFYEISGDLFPAHLSQ